jgi:ribosomal protein L31E
VVTSDDLHRAFSLYWMLVRMRESMGSDAWKRAYGHIIRIIDKEIAPKFDAELVALQRQRAKAEPHPFWRDPDLLEGAA